MPKSCTTNSPPTRTPCLRLDPSNSPPLFGMKDEDRYTKASSCALPTSPRPYSTLPFRTIGKVSSWKIALSFVFSQNIARLKQHPLQKQLRNSYESGIILGKLTACKVELRPSKSHSFIAVCHAYLCKSGVHAFLL